LSVLLYIRAETEEEILDIALDNRADTELETTDMQGLARIQMLT
jgi:hypothetical protein